MQPVKYSREQVISVHKNKAEGGCFNLISSS